MSRQENAAAQGRMAAGPAAPARLALALEPRFMFDAAGAASAAAAVEAPADPFAAAGAAPAADLAAALTAEADHTAGSAAEPAAILPAAAPAEPAAAAPAGGRTEIVVIDTGLANWQALRDAVAPGVELLLVDPTQDGLQQLTAALAGRSGIDALHIVSHGTAAGFSLGTARVTQDALAGQAAAWQAIGGALASDGDILLYGCQTGQGMFGDLFVRALAEATDADVAASSDDTGSASAGANWLLERRQGAIEASLPLQGIAERYAGILAAAGAPLTLGMSSDSLVLLGTSGLANGVAQDGQGNVYYAGGFGPASSAAGTAVTIDFDPGAGTETRTHSYNNSRTLFLAKYTTDGALAWVKTWGSDKASSTYNDQPVGVTVDSSGNVLFAANVYGSATSFDLDPGAGTVPLTDGVSNDKGYFISLTSAGDFRWAATMSGGGNPATNLAADGNGNTYITVRYSGPSGGSYAYSRLTTGITSSSSGTATDLNGGGNTSMFVAKLDQAGALQWLKRVENPPGDSGTSMGLAVTSGGDVYVSAAPYKGAPTATIVDPGGANISFSVATDNFDALLWKLDTSGTTQWVRQIAAVSGSGTLAIAIGANDDPVIAGTFTGSNVDLDPGTSTQSLKTSSGNDVFVAQLDPATGAARWVTTAGGSGSDSLQRLVTDSSGNIYAGVSFPGTGTTFPVAGTFASVGGSDAAIWKLDSSGNTAWVSTVGSSGTDAVRGLVVSGTQLRVALTGPRGADLDPGAGTLTAAAEVSGTGNVTSSVSLRLSDGQLAPAAAAAEIALEGNGTGIADGDPTPDSADHTDFGSAAVAGGTVDRTFTIQNSGAGTLTISGITLSNTTDFSFVGAIPTSVAASGTATFTIRFDPASAGTRTATVTIASDDGDEASYDFAITGTGTANATPTVTAPTAPVVMENGAAVAVADDIEIADADAGDTQTVTLGFTGGTGTLGITTGLSFTTGTGTGDASMVFSGSLAAVNAALDSLTFTPTPNAAGSAAISIASHDGTAGSATATTDFTIADLDPIIAPAQAFSLPEDAAIGTVIGTVAVTGDADGLSFSITGGNAGNLFAIDAATGVITLAAALDRETAASHSLTIAVDDEDGGSTADSSATVTITVTDVNDRAPVVTPGQSLSVAENSAAGTSLGSAAATDADASFTASAWSITGGSGQGLFDIDATTGAITVASGASLNFEAASSYTLTLTVSDSVNTAAPASIAISVTDVNEAPTDITLGATSIAASATSAGAAVGSLGASDPDAGGSFTFSLASGSGDADNASFQVSGSTLQTSGALAAGVYTVRIRATDQGGLSHERSFTISAGPDAPGVPDLAAGSDNGSSATDNLTHATSLVFTGTGTAGADLLLFQDGNANGALDAGEASASTTIDGNGDWSATLDASALGDGAHAIRAIQTISGLDSAASTALSVTIDRGAPALPSAPGLATASNSGSTADSLTNVTTPTLTGTAEAHAVVTLLVDGVAIGTTTADGSGAWSFTPGTALAGGSRSITATATDAAGNASAASGALALTLDATAPAWTTGGTASLAEGTTAVANLAASDGQAVTFAILGGADQARFSLSGAALAFATAPDFEAPADAGADNTYVVTLRATDAAGNTADLTLSVGVTNQNEAPAAPSDADAGVESVAEGATTGTSVGLTAAATDPDAGASLTYSLTDDAGGRFAIDATTGIVTVADGTLLDFEAAASHAVTVQVSDGSLTATRSFTIAVANVNEAPVLSGSLGASWVESAGLAGSTGFAGNSVALFSGAAIADPDSPAGFAGASLTVGFASHLGGDLITLPASQGALSYDSTSGAVEVGGVQIGTASGGFGSALVVSFNGAATAAAIDTVLANILYNSYGGDDPTDGGSAPTRAITASFADGGNSGSGSSLTSASLTGTLTLTATNDAEAFTGSLTTTPYVEGGTALALLGTATIGRIDAASLQGGSLTIGFGAYQPGDRLGIAEGGGITLAGGTLSHGGQVIGTVSGGVEADLVISFTTADASQAAVQALAGQLVYTSLSDDPTAGGTAASRTVTLTLSDGGATGGTAATTQVTGSLALTAVNDAPSLAANAGATTETGGQVTLTPAMLAASDPDDGPAGLSFTLTTAPTAGTLYRDSNDNGLLDGGEALAAGDSVTQMEINLGRVIYRHGGGPGTSEGFTLALADGGEDGAPPVTGQSFVLSVAMRPVVAIGGGSPTHAEDGAATAIAPNLSLADDDSANLAGATVTVTDLVAGDLLGFTDQAGITGSFDAATGVLTLTGTASRAAYEAALRSVTYRSSNDNPATGAGNADRVIEFRVTDGALQSLAGIGQTVAVTNANDAPSLDATQLPMLSGIAEDAAAPLAGSTAGSTLVASLLGGAADADTGALQGLAITGVSALGSLHYSTDGGASWTQVTATLSDANALLLAADARIAFVAEAERNGSIAEAITFRAWDRSTGSNGTLAAIAATGGGTAFSADADSAGILVAAMNDAPGFTAGASLAAVEEDTAQPPGASIASLFAGRFSDAVDAVSGGSAANALSGIAIAADASTTPEGAWQYSTDAGAHWHAVGAVSGGAALLLDASTLLRFLPAANHNGAVGGLTVHAVEDSAATSFTSGATRQTLDLAAAGGTSAVSAAGVALATSITALNDAPVAVADAGAATEAGGSANASPGSPASGNVLTNDTDIDAGATLAVSAVQHGATAGTLGQALAGAHGTLTLQTDGSYSYAVNEADPAVQALAAGQSLTDSFSYTVSDGSLGDTGLVTITIAGANDAPVLAGGGSAQAVQRDQPVPLGASVTVTDPDNAGFAGGTLTVGITAGGAGQDGLAGAQDLLGLGHAGTGAGEIGLSGHAVSYGGQAIGTWSGGAGAPLVIALNGNADASAVAALVAALTYANASAGGALVVTERTVTLTFTDGSGGTSNAVTTTMAVNRPPVLAVNTGVAGAEGAVVTITAAQLAAEDPDGSTAAELVFTLTTAPAQGSLFLDANGNAALDAGEALAQGDSFTQADIAAGRLAYRQDGSESTADGFGLGLTDRDGVGTGGLSVALTIAPVNDAPGLTDGATQALAGTDEDTAGAGSLVSTLLAGAGLTDADAGALGGMAVVAAQGSGSWQYSVDGLAWTDFGPVSAEAALLLSAETQLRYLPDAANGETASLGFRAWDRTSGTASAQGAPSTADTTAQGGSTPFSTGLAGATLAVAAVNDVPVPGGGLAGQPATDAAGLAPFAGFTIADVDSGQPLSIAITLRDAGGTATDANGGFTEASLAATGFGRTGTGLYAGSFAGAAEAEAALRALVFAPMPNQLDPGASVTTRFAIAVTDAVENGQGGATATDDTTTVDVTSANDAPVLGGGSPDQAITDGQILLPFASITLADADATQDQAVSVTLRDADGNATDANGGFTEASLAAAGFSKTGTGLYAGSFTSAAVAEAALRQLVFAPTPDQLLPGTSGTTRFAVTVTDAALNGQGGASAAQPASLTVASVNDAPVALLPPIPAQSYRTDAGYSLALPMTGFADADAPGGDRLAFSLSGPPGLTLAASGGVLTIAAGASAVAAGSHAVTLTATDLSGATAQVSFVLEVGSAPPPPLPAPPPPAAPPPAPPPVAPSGVPTPILAAVAQRGSESVGPAAASPPLPSFAPAFALTPSPITAPVPGSRGAEAPGAVPSGGLVSFGREGGFLAGSGALRSIGEIGARQVAPGRETIIQLPAGSFRHSDPRASVAVEARLADGRPLPSWARFDPATGSIQLSPPPGLQGTLSVQVIARDGAGNEASIRVEITVGEGAPAAGPADAPAPPPERGAALPAWLDPAELAEAEAAAPDPDAAPPGKPGLSEQLRQAGAEGRLDALLRALGELAELDDVA